MCSLAGEQWPVLECPDCVTGVGFCLLGLLSCESGATFVNTQVGTFHAKKLPRVFGTGSSGRYCVLCRNKVKYVAAFPVSCFHVIEGNE